MRAGAPSAGLLGNELTLARWRQQKQSREPFVISVPFARPCSGCWHSSLTAFLMTGLPNSLGGGDSALEPQLYDPAAIGPELVSRFQVPPDSDSQRDPDAWRHEVAARLARYRTRRKPRAPRYPSLFLPFDSHDDRSHSRAIAASAPLAISEPAIGSSPSEEVIAPMSVFSDQVEPHDAEPGLIQFEHHTKPQVGPAPEITAKIIEFPRSAAIPVVQPTPLADPIFDRPRIVEAPEILPPAPALGGILIEPVQPEPAERLSRAESPIPSASIARRLLAAGFDALILLGALSAFAAIFLRLNPIRGPLPLLTGVAVSLAVLLWVVYQFLFIGVIGSTLGLRAAGLKLAKFDGTPVDRRTRRWRVLASFLSAFSAGLGYLWCFLDQDSLCWHDRITRTSLQSVRQSR